MTRNIFLCPAAFPRLVSKPPCPLEAYQNLLAWKSRCKIWSYTGFWIVCPKMKCMPLLFKYSKTEQHIIIFFQDWTKYIDLTSTRGVCIDFINLPSIHALRMQSAHFRKMCVFISCREGEKKGELIFWQFIRQINLKYSIKEWPTRRFRALFLILGVQCNLSAIIY